MENTLTRRLRCSFSVRARLVRRAKNTRARECVYPRTRMGKSTHWLFFVFAISDAVSENRKVNLRKQIAAKCASFKTAHRTKPCTPQTDHKNLRVRRCVRVVPTRHSRPLSHAQRRTQFPLANMVRARTSLGASSRAAGGRGDASRLASRVVARFRASRSVSAFHRALATRAIGIARGRRPGDARRAAAAATGSSVCHVAVAASRPALARSPRGRGGVPSRGQIVWANRGGPLRVFLFARG